MTLLGNRLSSFSRGLPYFVGGGFLYLQGIDNQVLSRLNSGSVLFEMGSRRFILKIKLLSKKNSISKKVQFYCKNKTL